MATERLLPQTITNFVVPMANIRVKRMYVNTLFNIAEVALLIELQQYVAQASLSNVVEQRERPRFIRRFGKKKRTVRFLLLWYWISSTLGP